jgi:hypothetical protein
MWGSSHPTSYDQIQWLHLVLQRVPTVIFWAYFLTYFCTYRLLGGKDMAGKSHSRQKTAWAATKPLGTNQPAYFSAWLAGNVNSEEQKIISNCCPFK